MFEMMGLDGKPKATLMSACALVFLFLTNLSVSAQAQAPQSTSPSTVTGEPRLSSGSLLLGISDPWGTPKFVIFDPQTGSVISSVALSAWNDDTSGFASDGTRAWYFINNVYGSSLGDCPTNSDAEFVPYDITTGAESGCFIIDPHPGYAASAGVGLAFAADKLVLLSNGTYTGGWTCSTNCIVKVDPVSHEWSQIPLSASAPAYSSRTCFGGSANSQVVYYVATGEKQIVGVNTNDGSVSAILASPNGESLASVAYDGNVVYAMGSSKWMIYTLNATTGAILSSVPLPTEVANYWLGVIPGTTPSCTLACTASATPTSGSPPLVVNFTATATPSGCTSQPTFAWTLDDGGTSTDQNPAHTYSSAGTYNWTMTASVQGVTCTKTGMITVSTGQCTDSASFISKTVTDGTVMQPGQSFTQAWTIQNSGTCTWDSRYVFRHVSGQLAVSTADIPVSGTVAPGGQTAFSVPMKAPATAGSYEDDWSLISPSGGVIPVSGYQTNWCKIVVQGSGEATDFVFPVLAIGQADPTGNKTNPIGQGWSGKGVGETSAAKGHLGQDYYLTDGTDSAGQPVYAIADGEIVEVLNGPGKYGWCNNKDHGWGPVVVIKHTRAASFVVSDDAVVDPGGCGTDRSPTVVYSLYGHVSKSSITGLAIGQRVSKGQQIAVIGKYGVDQNSWTTDHLHFELKDEKGFNEGTWYKKNPKQCPGAIAYWCKSTEVKGAGTGYSKKDGFAPFHYKPEVFIPGNQAP